MYVCMYVCMNFLCNLLLILLSAKQDRKLTSLQARKRELTPQGIRAYQQNQFLPVELSHLYDPSC